MEKDLIFESFRNCISSKKCDGCEWKTCKIVKNRNIAIPVDLALAVTSLISEEMKEQKITAYWRDDTAHYIDGDRGQGEAIYTFRCSFCGFYQYWKTPFCPNCGTKMAKNKDVNKHG